MHNVLRLAEDGPLATDRLFSRTDIMGHSISHAVNLAWAAGFLDGEAYLGLVLYRGLDRSRPGYRLNLSVTQNHKKTLKDLLAIVGRGGRIYKVKRQPTHKRQVWVLQFWGRHALAVIRKVLPYLRRKGARGETCLRAWTECKMDRHSGPNGWPQALWRLRAAYYKKIKEMP